MCVSFALAPGASRDVAFSVAWDFPVASFAETDADSRAKHADRFATAFIKRYARYHPHGTEDVPLGAAAPALAALALKEAADWEAAARAWQQPYVDSALDAPADGGEIELPPLHWSAGQLRDWMLKLEERFASEKAKAAARREASAAAGVAACAAR